MFSAGGSIIGYLKQDVIAGWFKNSEQLSHNPSSNTIVGSELENNTKTEQIKEERIEPVDSRKRTRRTRR